MLNILIAEGKALVLREAFEEGGVWHDLVVEKEGVDLSQGLAAYNMRGVAEKVRQIWANAKASQVFFYGQGGTRIADAPSVEQNVFTLFSSAKAAGENSLQPLAEALAPWELEIQAKVPTVGRVVEEVVGRSDFAGRPPEVIRKALFEVAEGQEMEATKSAKKMLVDLRRSLCHFKPEILVGLLDPTLNALVISDIVKNIQ